MESNLERYAEDARQHLAHVSESVARGFLFRHGYTSTSYALPEFYRASGFESMRLDPVEWGHNGYKGLRLSEPLELVAPKGEVGWRRFAVLHPYAFWHVVTSITDSYAWTRIQQLLSEESRVASYTLPTFRVDNLSTTQGMSISAWLRFAEGDLVADSARFSFLGKTDIQNFYPSVYTHSLAWAVDGREPIKLNKRNYLDFVGNRIDRLFQALHGGQTNGIPVGSMVSDLVSELLLVAVDKAVSSDLATSNPVPRVLVSRFRDDYRILAEDQHTARNVINSISKALHEGFNLHLNDSKTVVDNDVLSAAFRPWKVAEKNSIPIRRVSEQAEVLRGDVLRDALLETYQLQRRYKEGRVGITVLSSIYQNIERNRPQIKISAGDLRTCIAILRMMMHVREELAPHIAILADKLFDGFGENTVRPLIEAMIEEEGGVAGNDFMEIWLYRLTMHRFQDLSQRIIDSTSQPLLRMVRMEQPHYLEFSEILDLGRSEMVELEKFSFIDSGELGNSVGKPLDSSLVRPWGVSYV